MEFFNAYEDAKRAESYSKLEFPGTYYLAFRDLPGILRRHVTGTKAVDFGCGAGRSTRFLRALGFDAVGVDISSEMIKRARGLDPEGDYRLVTDGRLGPIVGRPVDVILSAFTFDNIPTETKKVDLFRQMKDLLAAGGRILNLVSSPDIYFYEWASFSTKDYPQNRNAKPGDVVLIVTTAVEDKRPVEDIIWPDENYRDVYEKAGLEILETNKPLGRESEPYPWVNETRIAPWVIYVLKKNCDA